MPRQILHLRPSQLPLALRVTWAITGVMSLLSTRPAVDFVWIFFGVAKDDPCENLMNLGVRRDGFAGFTEVELANFMRGEG
jgi:hypothetical protein